MRALLVIVIIVLLLVILGWLRFSSPDGNPTLQVDTEQMQQHADQVVDSTQQAADEASREVEDVDADRVLP